MLSPYFDKLVEKKRSLLDGLFSKENLISVLDFGAGNGKSFSEYIFLSIRKSQHKILLC